MEKKQFNKPFTNTPDIQLNKEAAEKDRKFSSLLNLTDEEFNQLHKDRLDMIINKLAGGFYDAKLGRKEGNPINKMDVMEIIHNTLPYETLLILATERVDRVLEDSLLQTIKANPFLSAIVLAGNQMK